MQAGTRHRQQGRAEGSSTPAARRRTSSTTSSRSTSGKTTVVTDGGVNFGTFDNSVIKNTDDINSPRVPGAAVRRQLQVHRQLGRGRQLDATSSRTSANFEGEAANQPGNYSIIGDRPEFYDAGAPLPTGRLDDYQAHSDAPVARLLDLSSRSARRERPRSCGVVYRYDSALTYSLIANKRARHHPARQMPGYATPPHDPDAVLRGARLPAVQPQYLADFRCTTKCRSTRRPVRSSRPRLPECSSTSSRSSASTGRSP